MQAIVSPWEIDSQGFKTIYGFGTVFNYSGYQSLINSERQEMNNLSQTFSFCKDEIAENSLA